ncbi:MAG TPA: hypothetical protein VMU41_06500 [Candidatus Binataceae bacterium]|nr:hypothetical protein [Candidatus Binataceae bacterium]
MRTHLRKNYLTRLGLILAAIVFGTAASVQAQSQLQLPPPRFTPPPVSHSQNSETIPSNPMLSQPSSPPPEELPENTPQDEPPEAEAPPPAVMTEPILPAIFRGCWQGEVYTLDDLERLPGAARLGTWTPKTYRICYQRYGTGPYQLTFTDTGMAHDDRIISPTGTMQLLSTQGQTAMMLGSLHFEEYLPSPASFFGFGGGNATFPVDESTKLRCVIDSQGMHVWATVYGLREGQPWFQAHWHALFLPVPT